VSSVSDKLDLKWFTVTRVTRVTGVLVSGKFESSLLTVAGVAGVAG
jgi:hypothetical protein